MGAQCIGHNHEHERCHGCCTSAGTRYGIEGAASRVLVIAAAVGVNFVRNAGVLHGAAGLQGRGAKRPPERRNEAVSTRAMHESFDNATIYCTYVIYKIQGE